MYFFKVFFLSTILLSLIPVNANEIQYEIKQKLLSVTNNIRAQGAICAPAARVLRWNSNLERSANVHATDMAINNFLSHTGSGTIYDIVGSALGKRSSFIDRIKYFGFQFNPGILIGENIARISTYNIKRYDVVDYYEKALKTWLKETYHCEIIMNNRFSDIGISYYKKDDKYYFVMELGEVK